MKKAVIFTDDSGVKLPEIHKWKKVVGKASDIRKNANVLDALKKANLDVPGDDIDLEDIYRRTLSEFVRPARLMFAGMFGEIRIFHDILQEILPTELYIVSGRYGLVGADEEIIPYSAHIETVEDLERLNNKAHFSKAMLEASSDKQFIIMCYPSHYLQFLINEGWFEKIGTEHLFCIVAGSNIQSELSEHPNIMLFEKRGVARLGKDNQAKIIDRIKSEIKGKEE
jgi:hypothetical protein